MVADDKCMFAPGKPFGKFYIQAVGFLRGDLPRAEGLANMVGDHNIRTPDPSDGGDLLALCKHKLGANHTAVALIAGDEPAVIGLLWVSHIVDYLGDGTVSLCQIASNLLKRQTPGTAQFQGFYHF